VDGSVNNFAYSILSFVVALFFILIGIVGILIPWSINVRTLLTKFIFEDAIAISLFGFTFFVIGLAIVIHILFNAQKKHYKISSLKGPTTVDEAVIQEYLETYWKQLFPKNDIPCQLALKDNKIHVAVDLPYLPIQEQRPLLEKIRKDLMDMFTKVLGYRDEFFLSATFQNS
jgi:hypothetical protein